MTDPVAYIKGLVFGKYDTDWFSCHPLRSTGLPQLLAV